MKSSTFRKAIQQHHLWLKTEGRQGARINIESGAFQGSVLAGVNLQGSHWNEVNLSLSDLSGTQWQNADLHRVTIEESSLRHANFKRASASGIVFTSSDISNAVFDEADLKRANFSYVLGQSVSFFDADLRKTEMEEADLRKSDFTLADLSHGNLASADLQESCLSYVNLSYSCLRGADLRNTLMTGVSLEKADLRDALLDNAMLFHVKGDGRYVQSLSMKGYHIAYTYDRVFIERFSMTMEEFMSMRFSSENEQPANLPVGLSQSRTIHARRVILWLGRNYLNLRRWVIDHPAVPTHEPPFDPNDPIFRLIKSNLGRELSDQSLGNE